MFMLAPEERGALGRSVLWLGGVGCALLVAANFTSLWFPGRLMRNIGMAGGLIAAAGFITYLVDLVRLYRSRRRMRLELHNRVAIGAFIALGVALLWLVAALFSARIEMHAPALIYLILAGWLSALGLTQLYKIIAFLVWLQRYGVRLGYGPVPKVQDLVAESRAQSWFLLYFIGVAVTTVALVAAWILAARIGGALSLLATLALAREYLRTWRCHYVLHAPTTSPGQPPDFKRVY
jgi:hypothetical protein